MHVHKYPTNRRRIYFAAAIIILLLLLYLRYILTTPRLSVRKKATTLN